MKKLLLVVLLGFVGEGRAVIYLKNSSGAPITVGLNSWKAYNKEGTEMYY